MPDVEVETYWHTSWSSLVDDINRQPEGVLQLSSATVWARVIRRRAAIIIDFIIALQPSIFTQKTSLTGKVGRMVEIYDPNPLMTFGGMGSRKIDGPNIEYITNNDTHIERPTVRNSATW